MQTKLAPKAKLVTLGFEDLEVLRKVSFLLVATASDRHLS